MIEHPIHRALGKLSAPVPWMLEAAILLQLVLGDDVEASATAFLLVFNAGLGFFQEGRAKATLDALKSRLAVTASARRDGVWKTLSAVELVQGDVDKLSCGAVVSADVRLINGSILVDQSMLTGESVPIEAGPGFETYTGALIRRGEAVAVHAPAQQKRAIESGMWPLYRFDPSRVERGEAPLVLDSGPEQLDIATYMESEARFRMVELRSPERYAMLVDAARARRFDSGAPFTSSSHASICPRRRLMADLSTTWLGLSLRSPLVVAASPLSKDPNAIATAVTAGAGAVVMHSLFEEQLIHEQMAAHRFIDARTDMDAEARSILPDADVFSVDAEPYLAEIEKLRKRVDVPILASLNGTTPGGWTSYAKRLESAGADALELNIYEVTTSPDESAAAVEQRQLEVVRSVVETVKLPVSVKLTSFYASVPAFVQSLEQAGARGVVVFNRFYQPDIALDTLDVDRRLIPSTSAELPLRLHALALLSPTMKLSLACSGGVHSGLDAAKAILSGAHVVQLASVLLERGPQQVAVIRDELTRWLDDRGYKSSAEARGVLDFHSAPDPHAWERLNYARMLDGWRARDGWRRDP